METLNGNHNVPAHIDEDDINDKVNNTVISEERKLLWWDAADKLVKTIAFGE